MRERNGHALQRSWEKNSHERRLRTSLSAKTPTLEIIKLLNSMFSRFDELTDKHNVYKVETIGDAYMCASGHLPEDGDTSK